jgi:ubiquinone/menaquinone biosynthesis C-methylase UbiE
MELKNIVKQLSFNTFIPYFYPFMMLPLKYWRKKAIGLMNFMPGDTVLIPGVGNGYDIPHVPAGAKVVGVDISDVMLGLARAKLKLGAYGGNGKRPSHHVKLHTMDAENLDFPDNSFDKAILGLFLTCVYDPRKAFSEVVRVVKSGGEILVYDHLVSVGPRRKRILDAIEPVMKYNFCSVVRSFSDIVEGQNVDVIKIIPGDPFGFVKGFLLKKRPADANTEPSPSRFKWVNRVMGLWGGRALL